MIDWLLTPLDTARAHDVSAAVAWHGRLMTMAWGALVPLGVLAARYFKVAPGQRWPEELDNKSWWRTHLACQYFAGCLTLAGLGIVLFGGSGGSGAIHRLLGWSVATFAAAQFLAGWLRGTKGGPTERELRGDHYDMTLRRRVFEAAHKALGYAALALGAAAILSGLHAANAPRWMWLLLPGWWAVLAAAAFWLHVRRPVVPTYQAIWGPDPIHPGNRGRG
jgi:hypothetical protein